MLIHILVGGFPLCQFSSAVPGDWPEGNKWIREEEVSDYRARRDETICEDCREGLLRVRNTTIEIEGKPYRFIPPTNETKTEMIARLITTISEYETTCRFWLTKATADHNTEAARYWTIELNKARSGIGLEPLPVPKLE